MSSNFLDNGTVLPFGLLGGQNTEQALAAFNRTYANTGLKAGIVIKAYSSTDPKNITGLCTEYDVCVVEQSGDSGTVPTVYKNCLSSQGMGSIADYFEAALRPSTIQQVGKGPITFKDQDGSVVFIQCLDGMSEKGIIVGSFNNPNRPTKLTNTEPKLQGEYNGVNIVVNTDGSTVLSAKGPTNHKGAPTNGAFGVTEFKIEADGSFQLDHSTITIRADKKGTLTITSSADTVINCDNAKVNAKSNANVTAGADCNVKASGKVTVQAGADCNVTASGNAVVKAAEITLNGSGGKILTTTTDPVVDTIFGAPTEGVSTVKSG